MDGENENYLLDNLAIHRKQENANVPYLENNKSCGLHVVHGSFDTASEKTDCPLEANTVYKKFKNSPARLHFELNGLNEMHGQKYSSYLFSMNYRGLRWLNNLPAIGPIVKILPKLKVYSKK